jgi:anti-sigma factor RsiW
MNHPSREDWAAYVCGEGDERERRQRREHLAQCPACAEQVSAWETTAHRLQTWDFPPAVAPALALAPVAAGTPVVSISAGRRRPWLGWVSAAAAALLAGVGFLAGQWSAAKSLRGEMAQMLAEDRATARGDSRELLASVTALLERTRSEDRASILAMFRAVEERHAATYVALRRDLETLASMTDEEFERARLKLAQIALAPRRDGSAPH